MMLLTKALVERFAAVGDQDVPNPIVVAKFFHPFSRMYWFATAYHPEDRCFFGWVANGPDSELGYFSLDEFESVKIMGLGVERDRSFKECKLHDLPEYQDWKLEFAA
jgi:hypothetical protein